MKKILSVLILFIIILAIFIFAQPSLFKNKIEKEMIALNSKRVSSNIDFPKLRENIKTQFINNFTKKINENSRNTSSKGFGLNSSKDNAFIPYVAKELDKNISNLLLTNVNESKLEDILSSLRNNKEASKKIKTILKENIKTSISSINEFSLIVAAPKEISKKLSENIEIIVSREGLSWKITNIIIPFDMLNELGKMK